MKTIIIVLAFASVAWARPPQAPPLPQAPPMPTVTLQASEPERNIFDGYDVRNALQPQPAPVVHRGAPNVGSCSCNRSGGQCWCKPASICPSGCPINQAIKALRPEEVRYYFPQNCPTGN